MLQVTTQAASVLRDARSKHGLPEHFGLRVKPRPAGDAGIRLEFAAEPTEGDEVGVSQGLRIFVAEGLAMRLSALAIDARPTTEGLDLMLCNQADIDFA
jgi:Fe-S cluster assembly iron-binding protein IscA